MRLRRFRRLSLRNVLVVSQFAGSLMLLLITGVFVLGFQKIAGLEVGFDPRDLYLISVDPVRDGYSAGRSAALLEQLEERVKRQPWVRAATLTETAPMSVSGSVTYSAEGQSGRRALKWVVGKDYFETAGIPIVLGRNFRKEEGQIIVSEKLAREVWPKQDPLGRRIEIGDSNSARSDLFFGSAFDFRGSPAKRLFEVVGVAKDVKLQSTMDRPQAVIYFLLGPGDLAQPSPAGITLLVRGRPGVDALAGMRKEISSLDADVTPFNGRSMAEQIEVGAFPSRLGATCYGVMGVFGLILAAVGLAGVTAYSVAQRGREIGIRVALGARPGDVLGLVMREGAVLVAVGASLGLAGAWAGTRMLAALLSEVAKVTGTSASDPVLLVGAPLLLAGLALGACYVPARRSLRIDPVAALRQE